MPMYTRFVGKSLEHHSIFNFSENHPNLILEDDNDDILFPVRTSKLNENDKKLKCDKEKTWSDVLTSKKINSCNENEQKFVPNEISIEKESKVESLNSSEKLEPVSFNKKFESVLPSEKLESVSSSKKLESKKNLKVICDSSLREIPDEMNRIKNLKIKHLPILCIRGEPKIQKVVEISIESEQKNDLENAENNEMIDGVKIKVRA